MYIYIYYLLEEIDCHIEIDVIWNVTSSTQLKMDFLGDTLSNEVRHVR